MIECPDCGSEDVTVSKCTTCVDGTVPDLAGENSYRTECQDCEGCGKVAECDECGYEFVPEEDEDW